MQVVVSKRPAGKVAREEHPYQVSRKPVYVVLASDAEPVAAAISKDGNAVKPVHPRQAREKLVPADVSSAGNVLRLLQLNQVSKKFSTEAVLGSNGKLVKPVHPTQACWKDTAELVSILGKLVRAPQPPHAA